MMLTPWMTLSLLATLAFLAGSIPFGLVLARVMKGIDLRNYGSGNIGAANAFRALGPIGGTLVLLLDGFKGWGMVWLAAHLFGCPPSWMAEVSGMTLGLEWIEPTAPLAQVVVGLAAIIGHNNSLYLGFKGGKGIATTFGVMLAISPSATLVAALVWLAAVGLTRYSSVGSLSAALAIPITLHFQCAPKEYVAFGLIACAFAFLKHKKNIRNLLRGEELKLGRREE